MKKLAIWFLCIFSVSQTIAQAVRRPIAARYIGLGAYSRNHIDAFSFTANQASLAGIKHPSAGVYGERRFMLDATTMYSAVVVVPTAKGNFGLQADYFGFKNYNESQLGLAYARSLGSKVDLGIKFNYYSVKIPVYGSGSNINFEIGTILHLTEKLHAGIHAYNPVGGKFSKNSEEKLAAIYTFGLGYEPSENFLITTEISKEENQAVSITGALQYNFLKQFFARLGVESETGNAFGGAGISWKSFRLDINAAYHPQLGFSPGLLLILNLNKKQG